MLDLDQVVFTIVRLKLGIRPPDFGESGPEGWR